MIVWKEALYVAGIPQKKQKRIMRAVEKGHPVRDIYLIIAPSNEKNCLEYMKANQMLQPYYQKREVSVYGLAAGEEAAKELVVSMLCVTYLATGGFQVIPYLDRFSSAKAGDSA